jgi:hypothetical protein
MISNFERRCEAHVQRLLARLPTWASHWLGHRAAPPPMRPLWIVWLSSWVTAFCGLSVIMAVFGQAHYFIIRGVPLLVASYVRTLHFSLASRHSRS